LKKSTTQEQGQEMIVFAQKELDGMDIDGIIVGAAEKRGERERGSNEKKDGNALLDGTPHNMKPFFLPWSLLCMMMFVDKAINGLDVQCPMHNGIVKVEYQEIYWYRQENGPHRCIAQIPQDVWFLKTKSKKKVDKGTGLGLADGNKQLVGRSQIIEMLPSDRDSFGVHPN
jgi:hypothetical protein